MTCKTHYYTEVDETYHSKIMLLSILIRSIGSFIDGFQDMEIRVSTKLSLIHVVLVIRNGILGQKLYVICCLLETKILMHLNLEAFVLICCICLNLFDQSFMGIDILNSL